MTQFFLFSLKGNSSSLHFNFSFKLIFVFTRQLHLSSSYPENIAHQNFNKVHWVYFKIYILAFKWEIVVHLLANNVWAWFINATIRIIYWHAKLQALYNITIHNAYPLRDNRWIVHISAFIADMLRGRMSGKWRINNYASPLRLACRGYTLLRQ